MGASLSTMDLLSDLYMIYTYATTGKEGTALSLATMVGLCLFWQLVLVFSQTVKGGRKVMLKEMLIVISGLKPGWEAMKVANNSEQPAHANMSPESELTFTKCTEMCFESVPGSILTTYATLQSVKNGDGLNKLAVCSVVMSALTTGFSAATISFE
jgi:hypothetical protein